MFKTISINKNTIINFLLFIIILIFLSRVIYNIFNEGSDFDIPYTLSKLFYQKIDIFQDLSRNPLYPHSLYFLFGPFTLFSLETAKIIFFLLNIFFLINLILYLKKIFQLSINEVKIIFLIAFTATPFTNLLAIGNLSLLIFYCLIHYYYNRSNLSKSLYLLISFFKYNVSFIFIIYSFINKEYKVLTYFISLNLFFAVCYYLYLDNFSIERIFDPYILALELVRGGGEVNNIGKSFFSIQSILIYFNLDKFYPLFFLLSLVLIFLAYKKLEVENHTKLVSLFIFSSILVYHGMYEFIILLPFAVYVLKNRRIISYSNFHIFSIFFIFYFFKINKVIFKNFISDDIISIIGCLLLIFSSIILITVNSKELLEFNRKD